MVNEWLMDGYWVVNEWLFPESYANVIGVDPSSMGWISPWEDTANMANQPEKLGDSIVVEKSMIESSKKTILSQFFQGPWEVTQSGRGDERAMERYGKAAWNDTADVPWFFVLMPTCINQPPFCWIATSGTTKSFRRRRAGWNYCESLPWHNIRSCTVSCCVPKRRRDARGRWFGLQGKKPWNAAWGLCGTDQRCLNLGAVKHVKHVHSNSESDHQWEWMNQMTWQFLPANLR